MRWLTWWVLLCIGVQACLAPAHRAAEAAHFHRGAGYLQNLANDQADHDHDHDRPSGRSHAHLYLAIHGHDHADAHDLVYVSLDAAEPPPAQAHGLKRGALDVDGLWLSRTSFVFGIPAGQRFTESALRYHSQVAQPLERPPRTGG